MHPVVVLAGGHGTRVRHLTGVERSKVLLAVDGRPFIDFKLASLAAAGVTEVMLLVGHGAGSLREHVGAGGDYRLRVTYLDEGDELLGTGGAIARALPRLPETFWVTYGDTLLDVPLQQVEAQLESQDVVGVMTIFENCDRWAPSNVDVDGDLVVAHEKGVPPGTYRWIDYGMMLFRRTAFTGFAPGSTFDLGDVVRRLAAGRRLGAFAVRERFHEVGTEEAWRATDAWARANGIWTRLQDRIENRATSDVRRS